MSTHSERMRRRRIIGAAVAEVLEPRRLLAVYPASTFSGPAVAVSGYNYNFTVSYSSSLNVRRSTLDNKDITVTGPNGFSQNARLLSVDKNVDSPTLVATYRIQAPDGMWDYPDSGVYTFNLNKAQVRDAANNPVRLKKLKVITLDLPPALTFPSTTVSATNIDRWSGTYTFKVTYASSLGMNSATVDDRDITVTGPNGYAQKARLHSLQVVNSRTIVARYKITSPDTYWNAAQNGTYTFNVNAGQVRDLQNNPTRQRVVGTMTVGVPQFPTNVGQVQQLTPGAVDVRNFGAIPNDGIDDSNAIQAAIDSLPDSDGVPVGTSPGGGVVLIPAGTFDLSRPLKLTSGQWLRGVGDQTILNNTSTSAASTAIFLYSAFGHGSCNDPHVENLRIKTAAAKGIQVDPTMTGTLVGLRIDGVTISSGGMAIDLSGVDVGQSTINNVTFVDPGAAALWLRISRSNAALNRVTGLTVTGTARSGFDNSLPLLSLGGHITVADIDIHEIGATVVPLSMYQADGSMQNVNIQTLASHLQNGRVMVFDSSLYRLDRLEGLSSSRRLAVVNSPQIHIEEVGIATGSTVANSVQVDAASHLTIEQAHSASGVGAVSPSHVIVRSHSANSMSGATGQQPVGTTTELAPVSTRIVDVRSFGATPNDNTDDTAAIQAAIDSLPRGNGIPGSGTLVGGTVFFPLGAFNTSGPIRIGSGVWLTGQGDGTVIRNNSTDANSAAILFVSGAAAGWNIGAGVTNLGLYTINSARGIAADSAITNGLVDPRLANIQMSIGGVAIDLHNVKTYHARFDSIRNNSPGSTTLWLGDSAGYSADNIVIHLGTFGATRSTFVPNTPAVIVSGQTELHSPWIETTGADYLPMKVSGSLVMTGLWAEYHPSNPPDRTLISFENCYAVDIDRIILVGENNRLRFRNSSGVRIGNVDIAGMITQLSRSLDLDNASRITIDTVRSIFDSGMLDDPRMKIGGVYNQTAAVYTDTTLALTGSNLVVDPNFTDVGPDATHDWWIGMGDELGEVKGNFTVEQTANGPRLRVDISANPNNRPVRVEPRLSIPGGQIGESLVGRWRVDGPDGAIAWGERFEYQYAGRAVGSQTAAVSPRVLLPDTEFIIVLPGTVGTYYISKVGVVVNG